MPNSKASLPQKVIKKWEIRQRLEFIETRLFWDGRLNRADLVNFFSVSIIQASKDIGRYLEIAPGNMDYDGSNKFYFRSQNFKPIFTQPSAEKYLLGLQALSSDQSDVKNVLWGQIPDVSIVPTPSRKIATDVLRILLSAIREKGDLEVLYQSMSRSEPIWRWVSPHAFSFDGLRWHCRAFCHEDEVFKDFLIARIMEVGKTRRGTVNHLLDREWNELEEIIIGPHPGLSATQKKVIESDYGMVDGRLNLCVRKASVFYFLKRLGLDGDPLKKQPEEQQIVLLRTLAASPLR
jgi:predicted DNA-binding transcriptional regulator YafY